MVALEAMACGAPTIVSEAVGPAGDIRQYVADEVIVFSESPGDSG
jgi:hypothetical protein